MKFLLKVHLPLPLTQKNIESGFFQVTTSSSSHNPEEVLTLVNQVAQVKLKRNVDDLRDSPLPKRKKHNEKCSPSFAEKSR